MTKAFIKSPTNESYVVEAVNVDVGDWVRIVDKDGVIWETHICNVLFMTTPPETEKGGE